MHDTRTIFGGDIVTGDDAISSLSRIDPWEERIVLQAHEVRAFVARYYLGVLEIRRQTRLREDDMFTALKRNLHIVDLRSYAERGIRRERPWGCRPRDDIASVFKMEFGRAGEVLHVSVTTGLVEFVRGKACSRRRRVRLDGITFVQIAFFVEFLKQIPQGLDILVIVGNIGVFEVHPIAHLLGEVRPLRRVFHYFAAASGIVLIHGDLLSDILFGDTEHLLYAQFHRQTVGIPTGLTAHLKALHGLETAEGILDGTRHHVVNTRHTVRRRRSFEEQELWVSLTGCDTLTK